MTGQDYAAEKVLAKKIMNGTVHYKIKWVGYDDPKDITYVFVILRCVLSVCLF